jgi:hypothetical protein
MEAVKPQIAHISNDSSLDEFAIDLEEECKAPNTAPNIQGHKGNKEQAGKPTDTKDECDLEDDSVVHYNGSEALSKIEKERIIKELLKGSNTNKPIKKYFDLYSTKLIPNSIHYEGKDNPGNLENEGDFRKAYAKLIHKVLADPHSKLLINEDEKKILEETKLRAEEPKSFIERAYSANTKSKQRIEQIRKELQGREMEECTFIPKSLRKGKKRSLDDFLESQQKYLINRNERIEKIKQEQKLQEEQTISPIPKINSSRSNIVKKEVVYERLFAKSKKEAVSPKLERRVVKKRGISRELALYEEAKKRQERIVNRQKEARKPRAISKSPSEIRSKNFYVYQKFVKEFDAVLNSLESANPESLTYSQLGTVT